MREAGKICMEIVFFAVFLTFLWRFSDDGGAMLEKLVPKLHFWIFLKIRSKQKIAFDKILFL